MDVAEHIDESFSSIIEFIGMLSVSTASSFIHAILPILTIWSCENKEIQAGINSFRSCLMAQLKRLSMNPCTKSRRIAVKAFILILKHVRVGYEAFRAAAQGSQSSSHLSASSSNYSQFPDTQSTGNIRNEKFLFSQLGSTQVMQNISFEKFKDWTAESQDLNKSLCIEIISLLHRTCYSAIFLSGPESSLEDSQGLVRSDIYWGLCEAAVRNDGLAESVLNFFLKMLCSSLPTPLVQFAMSYLKKSSITTAVEKDVSTQWLPNMNENSPRWLRLAHELLKRCNGSPLRIDRIIIPVSESSPTSIDPRYSEHPDILIWCIQLLLTLPRYKSFWNNYYDIRHNYMITPTQQLSTQCNNNSQSQQFFDSQFACSQSLISLSSSNISMGSPLSRKGFIRAVSLLNVITEQLAICKIKDLGFADLESSHDVSNGNPIGRCNRARLNMLIGIFDSLLEFQFKINQESINSFEENDLNDVEDKNKIDTDPVSCLFEKRKEVRNYLFSVKNTKENANSNSKANETVNVMDNETTANTSHNLTRRSLGSTNKPVKLPKSDIFLLGISSSADTTAYGNLLTSIQSAWRSAKLSFDSMVIARHKAIIQEKESKLDTSNLQEDTNCFNFPIKIPHMHVQIFAFTLRFLEVRLVGLIEIVRNTISGAIPCIYRESVISVVFETLKLLLPIYSILFNPRQSNTIAEESEKLSMLIEMFLTDGEFAVHLSNLGSTIVNIISACLELIFDGCLSSDVVKITDRLVIDLTTPLKNPISYVESCEKMILAMKNLNSGYETDSSVDYDKMTTQQESANSETSNHSELGVKLLNDALLGIISQLLTNFSLLSTDEMNPNIVQVMSSHLSILLPLFVKFSKVRVKYYEKTVDGKVNYESLEKVTQWLIKFIKRPLKTKNNSWGSIMPAKSQLVLQTFEIIRLISVSGQSFSSNSRQNDIDVLLLTVATDCHSISGDIEETLRTGNVNQIGLNNSTSPTTGNPIHQPVKLNIFDGHTVNYFGLKFVVSQLEISLFECSIMLNQLELSHKLLLDPFSVYNDQDSIDMEISQHKSRLESLLMRLIVLAECLDQIMQTSVLAPSPIADEIVSIGSQFIILNNNFAKHIFNICKWKIDMYPEQFEILVQTIGRQLSCHAYSFIYYLQYADTEHAKKQEELKPDTKVRKTMKRQIREVPIFIFNMEEYEKLIRRFSVKFKKPLAKNLKLGLARDFRIIETKLNSPPKSQLSSSILSDISKSSIIPENLSQKSQKTSASSEYPDPYEDHKMGTDAEKSRSENLLSEEEEEIAHESQLIERQSNSNNVEDDVELQQQEEDENEIINSDDDDDDPFNNKASDSEEEIIPETYDDQENDPPKTDDQPQPTSAMMNTQETPKSGIGIKRSLTHRFTTSGSVNQGFTPVMPNRPSSGLFAFKKRR